VCSFLDVIRLNHLNYNKQIDLDKLHSSIAYFKMRILIREPWALHMSILDESMNHLYFYVHGNV